MKKLLIFVVIFTLLISAFSLSGITADKAKFGGTIKVGITVDPEILNPLIANNRASSWILNNMYPTLLVFNEEAEKVPYVIEGYEISENGLDITVKLIEGIKWQDGVPFTTADVKFTGDIMYEGKYQWQADYFDRVKSVEIIDDLTIVYHMNKPSPGFITGIGFWQKIIPKHIWENIDNIKEFQNNENVVGMGPFKLVEAKRGQYYILESVDEWFGSPEGKPYLDRIIYRVYPDLNTMVLALKTGEIDLTVTGIPVPAAQELKNNDNFTVVSTLSLGFVYIGFNYENQFLKDKAIRHAISNAIDRERIVAIALQGAGMPMPNPISPVYKEYNNPDAEFPPYDTEAAKARLAEAGYKDTDNNGFINSPESGDNVSLELIFDGNDIYLDKASKIIVANLKEVGIELVLKPLEKTTYTDLLFNQRKFEVNLGGWGIIDDPFDSINTLYHSKAFLNFMGYKNDTLDEYIENCGSTVDVDKRNEWVAKFQKEFVDECPVVPLYVQQYYFAYNNKFGGIKVFPSDLRGVIDPQSMSQVYEK